MYTYSDSQCCRVKKTQLDSFNLNSQTFITQLGLALH